MFYIVLIIILIIISVSKENYSNCPRSYMDNLNKIQSLKPAEPLRGYTPNDYLYMTENVTELIPVNSNFFRNKY